MRSPFYLALVGLLAAGAALLVGTVFLVNGISEARQLDRAGLRLEELLAAGKAGASPRVVFALADGETRGGLLDREGERALAAAARDWLRRKGEPVPIPDDALAAGLPGVRFCARRWLLPWQVRRRSLRLSGLLARAGMVGARVEVLALGRGGAKAAFGMLGAGPATRVEKVVVVGADPGDAAPAAGPRKVGQVSYLWREEGRVGAVRLGEQDGRRAMGASARAAAAAGLLSPQAGPAPLSAPGEGVSGAWSGELVLGEDSIALALELAQSGARFEGRALEGGYSMGTRVDEVPGSVSQGEVLPDGTVRFVVIRRWGVSAPRPRMTEFIARASKSCGELSAGREEMSKELAKKETELQEATDPESLKLLKETRDQYKEGDALTNKLCELSRHYAEGYTLQLTGRLSPDRRSIDGEWTSGTGHRDRFSVSR